MSTFSQPAFYQARAGGTFKVPPASGRLFWALVSQSRSEAGSTRRDQEGMALLAVLWLAVALTMIGMTTAVLVRGESDQVSNHLDSERAYYLARGGLDNAIYAIMHSTGQPASSAEGPDDNGQFSPGQRWLRFNFGDGTADVQVMPENAKINVNAGSAAELGALFALLGESSDASDDLAEAIVDWRSPQVSSVSSPFDQFYAAVSPPYAARHGALPDLNELLAVKGMSGDLFFGRLAQTDQGAWKRLPPLGDLLTAQQNIFGINVNYAAEQTLEVQPGWNEEMAQAVVRVRDSKPFASLEELLASVPEVTGFQAMASITLSLPPVYTLSSTAWMAGSRVRRTVRALVRLDPQFPMGYRVLAWWSDWPWSAAPPADSDAEGGGGSQGSFQGGGSQI